MCVISLMLKNDIFYKSLQWPGARVAWWWKVHDNDRSQHQDQDHNNTTSKTRYWKLQKTDIRYYTSLLFWISVSTERFILFSNRCIHATSSNIVTMSPYWQGYFLNTVPMTELPDGWLTAWRQKQSVLKWPRLRPRPRPRTGDQSGGGRPRGGKTTAPAAGRGSGGPQGGGFIKLAAGPAGWLTNTNPGLVLCFYIHLSLSAWSRNVQQPAAAATTLAVVSWIDR